MNLAVSLSIDPSWLQEDEDFSSGFIRVLDHPFVVLNLGNGQGVSQIMQEVPASFYVFPGMLSRDEVSFGLLVNGFEGIGVLKDFDY